MATATFKQGTPLMVPYTPGSAVAEGAVIVVNDMVFIAHTDIAANELGSVSAGRAIYKVPKASGTAINGGIRLYWDAGNSRVTATKGSNKVFGWSCPDGALSAATTIEAVLAPEFDDIGSS